MMEFNPNNPMWLERDELNVDTAQGENSVSELDKTRNLLPSTNGGTWLLAGVSSGRLQVTSFVRAEH